MFITLAGHLGSGKSAVSRILRDKYGYEIHTTGSIMRRLAEEKGMSIVDFNIYAKDHPEVDDLIDNSTIELGKKSVGKKVIYDSRLAWHFLPYSFKVILTIYPRTAAERVYNANRGAVEKYACIEDAQKALATRTNEELTRFQTLYGQNIFDEKNFDLVVDTTIISAEQVADKIYAAAKKFYEN